MYTFRKAIGINWSSRAEFAFIQCGLDVSKFQSPMILFNGKSLTYGKWANIRISETPCVISMSQLHHIPTAITATVIVALRWYITLSIVLKYVSQCFIAVYLTEQMVTIRDNKYRAGNDKCTSAVLWSVQFETFEIPQLITSTWTITTM